MVLNITMDIYILDKNLKVHAFDKAKYYPEIFGASLKP
jgi:hypothetical protein